MDDDLLTQFTSITGASADRATQYLTVSDGILEQAIQLFFESGGVDMGEAVSDASRAPAGAVSNPVALDDDDDDEMTGTHSAEDDEAMARRLQQEMYGAQGAGGVEQDIRAPMARTTQTLLGPSSDDWRNDDPDLDRAVLEQISRRQRAAGLCKLCSLRGLVLTRVFYSGTTRHFQPGTVDMGRRGGSRHETTNPFTRDRRSIRCFVKSQPAR